MTTVITNITANCCLNREFDIDKLVEEHPYCYAIRNKKSENKKFFSAKVDCIFASALLFKNGNTVFVGANSVDNVYLACDVLCSYFDIDKRPEVYFSNFCSTANYGQRLNNESLYEFLRFQKDTKSIIYERELFPPIRLQTHLHTSTINIFDSGKLTSTGNRSRESAINSLETTLKAISESGCVR